ncbi:unnamed protein product, partial [Symbiodinium sp. KB8]
HVLYALAGCAEPTADNDDERGCSGQRTAFHAAVGVYLTNEVEPHWQQVQRMRMGGMLEDLSSLGFPSYSGIYVDGRTKDLAEDHERLFLDDYRSYDSKYQNPKHWFSSIRDINTSSLIPCKSWKGTAPLGLETFLRNFDTLEVDLALDFTGQEVVPYCPDGYWWLSNACRNNPADCIPCVTGSSLNYVYDADEVMIKATTWNMSLALATVDGHSAGTDFEKLVTEHRILFYFWEPDLTFRTKRAELIAFPEFNEQQWNLGKKATMARGLDLRIVSHWNLETLAPDVRDLMINMDVSTVEALRMMYASAEAAQTMRDLLGRTLELDEWWQGGWKGACEWILEKRLPFHFGLRV